MNGQAWKARRLKLIERAMFRLVALNSAGMDIRAAARRVASQFRGRDLGSGRYLQCSTTTILRWYYRWRLGRRNLKALDLLPRGGQASRIDLERLNHFFTVAIDAGLTVAACFNILGGAKKVGLTIHTLYRQLGPDMVRLARRNNELHQASRELEAEIYRAVAARNAHWKSLQDARHGLDAKERAKARRLGRSPEFRAWNGPCRDAGGRGPRRKA